MAIHRLVEWPRGEATACKAVYTGSNPVSTSLGAYGPLLSAAATTIGTKVKDIPGAKALAYVTVR